jgi:hypothetical protein
MRYSSKAYPLRLNEEACAAFFGLSLLTCLGAALAMAYFSAGPVILGSELNANGTVEYLCLGLACENFQAMDW